MTLNVGGRDFLTTAETLRNERSMLSALLGPIEGEDDDNTARSSFPAAPLDALGRIRIDRDPDAFGFVLDYLRTLDGFVPPEVAHRGFRVLEREAVFYGLANLCALLAARRETAEEGTPECIIVIDGLTDGFSHTEILGLFSALPRTPRLHFNNPVAVRPLRDPTRSTAAGAGAGSGAA